MDKSTIADLWNSLSPDLIGIQVDGRLVFINVAGAQLLGADGPEQLIGKPITDLIHPDYQGVARDITQCTRANKRRSN